MSDLSPYSGLISCAECGANYVFALEHKKTKSKSGKIVHDWYSLLIHSKNKKCSDPIKRIAISQIEEIVKNAYQKALPNGVPKAVTISNQVSDQKYRKEMIAWTRHIMVAVKQIREELGKPDSGPLEIGMKIEEATLDLRILSDIYAHPERSRRVTASGWKGIYDHVDAIEKAAFSRKFFVDKMRRPHTMYTLKLKFRGAKLMSIPVTKDMLLLKRQIKS